MIDIARLLTRLAIKRPIFHSEADFQHGLAWEIHQELPACSIRLEFKPPYLDDRLYLDIWTPNEEATLAVELKYKTRGLRIKVAGETFDLLNQSAQDVGRYDFCKDIQRLEQIVSKRSNVTGYAILLTNDSAYWSQPRSDRTVDASFRIHQGRILTGDLRWGANASRGTMRSREEPISIKGVYELDWKDYSEPSKGSYGKFKYLLVKVGSRHGV